MPTANSFSGFRFLPAPDIPDVAFIIILCSLRYSKIGQVNYTNDCVISLFSSSDTNEASNLVILSALDNLIKGASGQAIQNMNIMFNLPESLGLKAN